jgi:hypothetical protein
MDRWMQQKLAAAEAGRDPSVAPLTSEEKRLIEADPKR